MTPAPEARRRWVLDTYRAHLSSGLANLAEVAGMGIERQSDGAHVVDDTGRTFLNCGGYGVFTLGHRHPEVIRAVRDQLDRHPLATKFLVNDRLADAAAELAAVCPKPLKSVYFTNSGSEAVELALKLARGRGRRTVVSMAGGFHGKTTGALSVTGRAVYRTPFEPLLGGVVFAEYGNSGALAAELARHEPGSCAVILEPVQAENGVIVPPDGYLADVARLCAVHDAMLIVDEIQTGLGRLGTWWGIEREGVVPDVLLAGKALGGGVLPIGAVVTSEHIFAALSRDPYLHSSTFGGNQLAMAAACAALRVIERDNLVPKAGVLGERLLSRLRGTLLVEPFTPSVREIRGLGLLLAIEFANADQAGEFMFGLLEHGVISCHSMNAGSVVRLTPPAIIDAADEDWLIEAVAATAKEVHS
ncbi:aspartate aminotransferase family protein [Amycolatopsis sp. NPDC059090]|uniref:aspartate aminotransferase family protein n=1 Tax=unclassified Amycolatopsis TaxID=2618356 RepID=UPI00366B3E77